MGVFLSQLGLMSVQACCVILVVLAVRLVFGKLQVPKKYVVLLWLVPYLCMICPWKIESSFGFWKQPREYQLERINHVLQEVEEQVIQESTGNDWILVEVHETEATGDAINTNSIIEVSDTTEKNPQDSFAGAETIAGVLFGIWLAGVTGITLYSVFSYCRLKRKLLCSVRLCDNIYIADDIQTPFVLGIWCAKIYLPSDMGKENQLYVLAHESTHIHRKDTLWKLVVLVITTVHWFNPLAWIAMHIVEKDIEMACDEETVLRLGLEQKQAYATALLQLSAGKRMVLGAPLAFGEGNVISRIKNIVKYKKTLGIVSVLAVFVIGALTIVFMTQNSETEVTETGEQGLTAPIATAEPPRITSAPTGSVQVEVPLASIPTEEVISGVEGPILDYASDSMIVFHDYYGLFLYHIEKGLVGQIDLKKLGLEQISGADACCVEVTEDGSKIYLYGMESTDGYYYDVEQKKLYWLEKLDTDRIEMFQGLKQCSEYVTSDYTVLRSSLCVVTGEESYHYLESGSGLPIDLCWVTTNGSVVEHCPIFDKKWEGYLEDNVTTLPAYTMEDLITLCKAEKIGELWDTMQGFAWEDGVLPENFVKKDREGLWSYSCILPYQGREYRLEIHYFDVGKFFDELHAAYLTDITTQYGIEICFAGEVTITETKLQEFLNKVYELSEYISAFAIPEDMYLGEFDIMMQDMFQGCLLEQELKSMQYGDSVPKEWYAPGGIGFTEQVDRAVFEEGKLVQFLWSDNHSDGAFVEYVEGCVLPAALYEFSFDLFTAPQLWEYSQKYGIPEEAVESTSKFWYVFMGEPDGKRIYLLFLNQKYFRKEDMVKMAQSVLLP